MDLTSSTITDGTPIPAEFAFCIPDGESHVVFGANRNPGLSWSGVPDATRSLALICHDPDVPTRPDDVNQEGREVPDDLARTDFFHWVIADLDADLRSIDAGSFSDGVVPHGKARGITPVPCRLGTNDYTGWFAGDPNMEGQYFGYDGPCPPWNDSLIHHYIFTVFALDVPTLDLPDVFSGGDLRDAMEGHILESASVMGTYTLNPRLAS